MQQQLYRDYGIKLNIPSSYTKPR